MNELIQIRNILTNIENKLILYLKNNKGISNKQSYEIIINIFKFIINYEQYNNLIEYYLNNFHTNMKNDIIILNLIIKRINHGIDVARIKLNQCKLFLERIEAYLRSNKYFTVTANMTGQNPEQIASIISKGNVNDGLKGPTISKVYNTSSSDLYAVTMIINKDDLMGTVSSMRKIGAKTISVYKLDYLFDWESDSIKTLLEKSET